MVAKLFPMFILVLGRLDDVNGCLDPSSLGTTLPYGFPYGMPGFGLTPLFGSPTTAPVSHPYRLHNAWFPDSSILSHVPYTRCNSMPYTHAGIQEEQPHHLLKQYQCRLASTSHLDFHIIEELGFLVDMVNFVIHIIFHILVKPRIHMKSLLTILLEDMVNFHPLNLGIC